LTSALLLSLSAHGLAFVVFAFLFRSIDQYHRRAPAPATPPPRLVYIAIPRLDSGGGGSARPQDNRSAEKRLPQLVPEQRPVAIEPPPAIVPEPEPQAVAAPAVAAEAHADTGDAPQAGTGDRDRPGSGSGPRSGPGIGDGVFPVGNGVTAPVPIRRPPPKYTTDAMRARLQGVVVINCVVRPDGTCSDIRVLQSLDMVFGLDDQAIASAREWRFTPGTRLGEPVPVQVTLEIAFSIR
jgi:TonB family protein